MMKLTDLDKYNKITIQCHDNPDADAIASGYALYIYFKERGKDVSLIYSGRYEIKKANLVMMVKELEIPIKYYPLTDKRIEGLLITVDCQYGAGNITQFLAENVAIIDHHYAEVEENDMCVIRSDMGSCATVVWEMLNEAGFAVNENEKLGTALYYGLYMDTFQFAELYNPIDMDMRDQLVYDKSLLVMLKNSNLSLDEVEIIGKAMLGCIYCDKYNYAIIQVEPCDPNILGLLSDFMLQVASVYLCVVFNEANGGIKLSVRSCMEHARASELVEFLTENIGSGGGQYEKAGGFISKSRYLRYYQGVPAKEYIQSRLNEYFETIPVIRASSYTVDLDKMRKYKVQNVPVGFAKTTDIWPEGTCFSIRTLEGDIDMIAHPEKYLIIGMKEEVYPIQKSVFEKQYKVLSENYSFEMSYAPVVKNKKDGRAKLLSDYLGMCIGVSDDVIYARKLDKAIKVFGIWNEHKYMLGKCGDYLAVNADNLKDIYILDADFFEKRCSLCNGTVTGLSD